MLPGNSAASLLQQYLKTQQQGLFDVIRPEAGDLRFSVGERLQATVTGQLPGGRFAVLVKDQLLDLNLPRNTEPGEQLELDVVSDQPKLTFALVSRQPPAAAQQQTPGATLPQQPPSAEQAAFSKAGQFLSTVLTAEGEQTSAVPLSQTVPLFEGEPDPAQIAGKLQQKIAESGLFYESHQVEWAGGQRPLQALLREPQNQSLPHLAQPQVPAQQLVADESVPQNAGLLERQGQVAQSMQVADDGAPIRNLVQQQLNALEQKPLVWQGQAWPGQPMRWQMQLDNHAEREAGGDIGADAMRWQSRLDLDLPSLGAVSISTDLYQGRFSLRFDAQTPEAAERLKAGQALLGKQFAAAGLTLAATPLFAVAEEEHAGEAG
ncbi:hypothetical protein IGB42_00111 [Andreprevotia sp. IGB-42]|uniref:flagellar hook-length control protein FliK n=1 Tax=Andreprevotia sp. IGB-42 TaxID=2497473 RepID=UPI00135CED42|nr:flagellar hook-length control protein FliK [Andreprevotia sp. IGB-42]KAF0815034.1 hypothetical protein IGB42_00111 [Andreprevotia sp. IGB-42]